MLKWLLVALDRWSSYTVSTWADSALVVLDEWSWYRGGHINRFDFSPIQCLLSVVIWSYFIQCDVCRKMGQMYLSIVEEYFSVQVTRNLLIVLMNNTPPKSFSVDFIHFKYFFSLVFKHRTNWCLVSCFLYPLIFCFQIIAPQYYNYHINVSCIIWLTIFPV